MMFFSNSSLPAVVIFICLSVLGLAGCQKCSCNSKEKPRQPISAYLAPSTNFAVLIHRPANFFSSVADFTGQIANPRIKDQLEKVRIGLSFKYGLDPLSPKEMEKKGIDVDSPMLMALDNGKKTPFWVVPIKDQKKYEKFLANFLSTAYQKAVKVAETKSKNRKIYTAWLEVSGKRQKMFSYTYFHRRCLMVLAGKDISEDYLHTLWLRAEDAKKPNAQPPFVQLLDGLNPAEREKGLVILGRPGQQPKLKLAAAIGLQSSIFSLIFKQKTGWITGRFLLKPKRAASLAPFFVQPKETTQLTTFPAQVFFYLGSNFDTQGAADFMIKEIFSRQSVLLTRQKALFKEKYGLTPEQLAFALGGEVHLAMALADLAKVPIMEYGERLNLGRLFKGFLLVKLQQPEVIEQLLARIKQQFKEGEYQLEEQQVKGLRIVQVDLAEVYPGLTVQWARRDNYLLIGIGQDSLKKLLPIKLTTRQESSLRLHFNFGNLSASLKKFDSSSLGEGPLPFLIKTIVSNSTAVMEQFSQLKADLHLQGPWLKVESRIQLK